MGDEGTSLRRKLALLAEVKRRTREDDASYHLSLPLSERLLRTIRHSDEMLRAFPPDDDAPDDEAEVWARVREKLRKRS